MGVQSFGPVRRNTIVFAGLVEVLPIDRSNDFLQVSAGTPCV